MTDTLADYGKDNVLPNSMARSGKGAINVCGSYWVPIYCGNCGVDSNTVVQQEHIDFAFWLCVPCAEKFGEIAGIMLMPDEVFWEKLKQESFAHFGYYPTAEELDAVRTANSSPLATLLIEGR